MSSPNLRSLLLYSRNFAVAAVLVIGTLASAGSAAAQKNEVYDLAGKTVELLKAAAGKPFALIFVRTDCPISNRYAPTMERLQGEYAGRVAFWLVYPDNDEPAEKIHQHLKEYGLTLPVLRDPRHALVSMSHATVTPEAAVFSSAGELVYHGRIDNLYESIGRARNAPTTHELSDALQAVLAQKSPQISSATAVGCTIMDMR